MEKKITYTKDNKWTKVLIIVAIVLFAISFIFVSTGTLEKIGIDNHTEVYGQVEDIYYDDSKGLEIIKLSDGKTYTISKYFMNNYEYKLPQKGDSITVTYANYKKIFGNKAINKAYLVNELIIDTTPVINTNFKSLIIVGAIFTTIAFVCIGIRIYFKKHIKQVEMTYLEYRFKDLYPNHEIIHDSQYDTSKYYKRFKKALYAFLIIFGLIIVEIIVAAQFITDEMVVAVTFEVIGVGIAILLDSLFLFYFAFPGHFAKNRNIDKYLADYKKYLENVNELSYDFFSKSLTKEGLRGLDDYEEWKPIEDLNLYAIGVFTKSVCMIRIFISTEIDPVKYPDFENGEIIVELDGALLKRIKELNIDVKGLDYILNNLEEESNKYKNKKKEIISYKDK